MGVMCWGVTNKENHKRYFHSPFLAEKWAKKYNTEVIICFDIPKWKVEKI